MAKMRVTDAGEPCKEGAPTVEVKADTFGREIRNQVNPEVDGSGHWDINGDSIKFVPQSGTNNYEG